MTPGEAGASRPLPPVRLYRSRHWREAPLVALDFEATGLDLRRDMVVSFGAAPIDEGRIALGDAVYMEISPDVPPSPESIRIHQLRPADLAGAPELAEARERLRAVLDRRFLITWVAEVEIGFLARIFGGRRSAWARRTIDVARLIQAFDRIRRGAPGPAAGAPSRVRGATLSATAARFGVPVEDAHHALDDAVMTAELFLVIATKLEAHGYGKLRTYQRETGGPRPNA